MGDDGGSIGDNGGTPNRGGAGGSDDGGSDNGGSGNGGSGNGGSGNGGSDNGGSDNGGSDNGGSDNGGSDNGGAGASTDAGADASGGDAGSGISDGGTPVDLPDAAQSTFTLSVEVEGLEGTLTLEDGSGASLTVEANGTHAFADSYAEGTAYELAVVSDPELQNCHARDGQGTLNSDAAVRVTCHDNILMWIDDNPDPNEYNHELWASDGTSAGTHRVVEVNTDDTVGTGPVSLNRYGDWLYFANDDGTGTAMWRTDGTQANTVELRKFDFIDANMVVLDDVLYFEADGDPDGSELWSFDGNTFTRETSINPGGTASLGALIPFGSRLLFRASNPTFGDNPWLFTPSTGAQLMLADVAAGAFSGQVGDPEVVGNLAVFRAAYDSGTELWVTDGTENGTELLLDVNPDGSSSPSFIGRGSGIAFFRANDGSSGVEPWRTNGTESGTVLLRNINDGASSSNPSGVVSFNGSYWFTATDSQGTSIWITDGSQGNATRMEVFSTAVPNPSASQLTVVGEQLYFVADGADGAGAQLWRTDGTVGGAVRVSEVEQDGDAAVQIGPHDGRVLYFFVGYNTGELWATDGTRAGTAKVRDFCEEPDCYPYPQFVRINQ